jgi:HKD family nuclease
MGLTIELLANDLRPIGEALEKLLASSQEAFFAVAYGTHSAYKHLNKGGVVTDFLNRGSRLRAVFDIDRYLTDPDLIEEFCTVPGDVECKLYGPAIRGGGPITETRPFHPKVYYFADRDQAAAVIGSSNLSMGGLRDNHEVGILVKGSPEEGVFRDVRSHLREMWSSAGLISVEQYEAFRERYRKAYRGALRRQRDSGFREEVPLVQSVHELEELQKALRSAQDKSSTVSAAYLLGLVSGGGQRFDLRKREVDVMLRRGLLNRGKPHEGEIHFEGVGERNLQQAGCVSRDAERVVTRVRTSFEDLSTGDEVGSEKVVKLSHRIALKFSRGSGIWKSLKAELLASSNATGQYTWPTQMALTVPEIRRAFLQGYMDIRTRITAADALPRPKSYMRVAVSVGGSASDFSEKLRDLMAHEFGCEKEQIGLSKGGPRGREDLVRIEASRLPPSFLQSPWQRIVVSDFQAYNKRLDLV